MSAESDVETVEVTGDEERDNEGEGDGWVIVWRDSSDDSENGIHINNKKMFPIWMFKEKKKNCKLLYNISVWCMLMFRVATTIVKFYLKLNY